MESVLAFLRSLTDLALLTSCRPEVGSRREVLVGSTRAGILMLTSSMEDKALESLQSVVLDQSPGCSL